MMSAFLNCWFLINVFGLNFSTFLSYFDIYVVSFNISGQKYEKKNHCKNVFQSPKFLANRIILPLFFDPILAQTRPQKKGDGKNK